MQESLRSNDATEKDYLHVFLLKYPFLPSIALWRAEEASLFAPLVLEKPILDLACGNGCFAGIALKAQVTVGCDRDFIQTKRAKMSGAYQDTLVADICNLPHRDQSFATVISNCVLEHIQEPAKVLQEVFRVLAPGGTFIFTVPTEKFNEWFYLSWLFRKFRLNNLAIKQVERYNCAQFHYHICSLQEWSIRLKRAGLQIDKHRYYASRDFVILFSILDDLTQIVRSMARAKDSSSERWASQMSGLSAGRIGRFAACFWLYLLRSLQGKELPVGFDGAAVLIQARKPAS
ncbi:MAG: SAM-dependent methyltransferase [Candidatus Abyssobacteria bacterium SURF_17]|uniref:SAM-dependent methyltransferase n=1 Tax=Candidatus Abyssobacteria bacterium SURF_17 TaxID=2093361 RepID=A0A419F2Z0_9BACT|nr:MAG: SAM-dependent methyltransferase [Candidatus Abyssubacteria bacterium SURF_17]